MRFLTAGESHGEALSGIISEYPSGVKIDADFINNELSRRQKGYGRGGRVKIEADQVKILSGVRKNKSTGSPISFLIFNKDWQNRHQKPDIEESLLNPRPGHADLSGFLKYRLESIRDVNPKNVVIPATIIAVPIRWTQFWIVGIMARPGARSS